MAFTILNSNDTGPLAVFLGTVTYLTLVRLLRYRCINTTIKKYLAEHTLRKGAGGTNPSDYPMTPVEAQKIMRISSAYDAPWLVVKSLEFALFKTYGIVSRKALTRICGMPT